MRGVFSLRWLILLQTTGSSAQAQEFGGGTELLHGMWAGPGPGIEPVFPALAGRVFTTEAPGSPGVALMMSLFPDTQVILTHGVHANFFFLNLEGIYPCHV